MYRPYSSDEDYSSSDDYESIVNKPCWKIKRALNREDLWAVYVGLAYFAANFGLAFWGVQAPKFYIWTTPSWGNSTAIVATNNTAFDNGATFVPSNVIGMLLLVLSMIVAMSVVHKFLGRPDRTMYYIAMLSCVAMFKMMSMNSVLYRVGLGEPVMCLLFGIIAGWAMRRRRSQSVDAMSAPAVYPKFFIKVALILLASDLGVMRSDSYTWKWIIIAWCETVITFFVVLAAGVFLLKMYSQSALVISSGVTICGPTAAVLTSEIVSANKYVTENLIAMISVLTIPLIPTMYLLAARFDTSSVPQQKIDFIVGSWIGGSVDTAGGVISASSMLSLAALKIAMAVKMLQTLSMGPFSLLVTALWHRTISPSLLWERFPKSILAYTAVIAVTYFVPNGVRQLLIDNSFVFSEWFTALSFLLIGISIDLTKPNRFDIKVLILYILGQTLDLACTLGTAYVLSGLVG